MGSGEAIRKKREEEAVEKIEAIEIRVHTHSHTNLGFREDFSARKGKIG